MEYVNINLSTNDIANDETSNTPFDNSNTPYDDVHKTMSHDCPRLLIPVVNEAFQEKYTGDEKIKFLHNEHFINIEGKPTEEKITDSCFEIQSETIKKYLIESQSNADSSMPRRLFEYGSQVALDDAVEEGDQLVVDFPRTAVLFLRHTRNTPDEMKIKIQTTGGSVLYNVPVIKIQKYTLQEIFEKNLLFFLPFYIFRYSKKLKVYEANSKKLQELKAEYSYIRERLETLSSEGKITEFEKYTLFRMSQKVIDALAKNYPQVREGVGTIMGGKILDYDAKIILQSGIREGERNGKILTYLEFVKEGFLTLAEAAKRLNMKEEELKNYLQ